MAGEFSFDEFDFSFDSLTQNGIHKCKRCNMFVPYRSLAEHLQLRHKETRNNRVNHNDIDDGNETDGRSMVAPANQCNLTDDMVFRNRVKSKCMDSDFDTTDGESMVAENKNKNRNDGTGANAAPKAHGGRTAVRGADRYQARRLAKLQMEREQANQQNKFNGVDDSSAQMRRKIPTAIEMFSSGRSHSEKRAQKMNGIFGGASCGGGVAGNERGNMKKFGQMRRSASLQRNQVVPENFEHCKFCLNLMHKDYVDDHMRRKHGVDEPATDNGTDNGPINGKETIVNVVASGGSSSDVSGLDDNLNGQSDGAQTNGKLNEESNGISTDNKMDNASAPAKTNKTTKVDKHKGFRRCQFCEAFMHTDYLPCHLLRKHKTEFIGAGGITWLKYSDEQMNKLMKEGRLICKDGALYIQNA